MFLNFIPKYFVHLEFYQENFEQINLSSVYLNLQHPHHIDF